MTSATPDAHDTDTDDTDVDDSGASAEMDDETSGSGHDSGEDEDGSVEDEIEEDAEDAEEPGPSKDHRRLIRRLSDLDPRLAEIIEERADAFVANATAFMAQDPPTRKRKLPDESQERKRRRVERVTERFGKVREERGLLQTHLGSSTPSTGAAKPRKVTKVGVKNAATAHVRGAGPDPARPYGHQKGSLNLNPGGVRRTPPEVKIGRQTRQYLTELSTVLFARVSTMEVESMLVNDRILVSANETDTVTAMAASVLKDVLHGIIEPFEADNADNALLRQYRIAVAGEALSLRPDEEITAAHRAGMRALAETEAGHYLDHGARAGLESFLGVLKQQVQNALAMTGPVSIDQAARLVLDPGERRSVIAVDALGGGDSHAEQHLLLALIRSGFRGRAVVAGTKRPCAVCWLSLALAQQNGWDVEFNNEAGAYWNTSVIGGLQAVATAVGITDLTDVATMFARTNGIQPGGTQFVQYLTDLNEQIEGTGLVVTVPAEGGGLAERGLVQDISGLHEDFIGTAPDSPLRSPYGERPESPPGFYGTPQSSQEPDSDEERVEPTRWWNQGERSDDED